jgi:hypothetical protein
LILSIYSNLLLQLSLTGLKVGLIIITLASRKYNIISIILLIHAFLSR